MRIKGASILAGLAKILSGSLCIACCLIVMSNLPGKGTSLAQPAQSGDQCLGCASMEQAATCQGNLIVNQAAEFFMAKVVNRRTLIANVIATICSHFEYIPAFCSAHFFNQTMTDK